MKHARAVAHAAAGPGSTLVNDFTFHLADAAEDLTNKGKNAVIKATGGKIPYTSEEYRKARTEERSKDKAAPLEGIAGSVISPLGAALAPEKIGAMTLGPLARALFGGAAGGAVTAGADSQGGIGDRVQQVASGAGEGVLGGGLLHGAGKVLGSAARGIDANLFDYKGGDLLRKVLTKLPGSVFMRPMPGPEGAERAALDRVRRFQGMEKPENRDVKGRVKEYKDAGVSPPTFGEVAGHNTNSLFRNANSKIGEGRSAAIDYRKIVRGNAAPSAQEQSVKLSPAEHRGKAVSEVKEALEKRQSDLASTQYREPYAQPIKADDRLAEILDFDEGRNAFRDAIKTAKARELDDPGAKEEGVQLRALQKYLADRDAFHEEVRRFPEKKAAYEKALQEHAAGKGEGTYDTPPPPEAMEILNSPAPDNFKAAIRKAYGYKPPEPPKPPEMPKPPEPPEISAGTIDRLRIAIRDKGRSLYDLNRRSLGGGVGNRAKALDAYLDSVPHLQEARQTYRGIQRQIDALDFKESVFGPHSEFSARLKNMSPEERGPLKKLIEQEITADMKTPGQALSREDAFSYGTDAAKNIKALFGDAEGDRFLKAMQLLQKRSQQANFVAPDTGSQTEPRKSEGAQIAHAGAKALFGHVKPLLAHMASIAMNPSMTEKEAQELTKLNLSPASKVARKLRTSTPKQAINPKTGKPWPKINPSAAAGSALDQVLNAPPN
jgi:hypothetical protein